MIDADVPLRPGAVLSLEIIGDGLEAVAKLQVLRCHVASLSAEKARYRGACAFTQPLELPVLHPLPDLVDGSGDPYQTVDAALRRLVERACAPDGARLAAGDVFLTLQAFARRVQHMNDAFGRHIGTLVQAVLPVLQQNELGSTLGAIERELQQAVPQARLRLVDGRTPSPQGAKSVLIKMPGAVASVSIDLPAAAVLDDAQARLLRTTSRLIALAQRLNTYVIPGRSSQPDPGTAAADAHPMPRPSPDADPPPGGSWQKIVVRYSDGRILKGFTQDFHGSKSQFSLWPAINAASHERVVVPLALLKAVFFVREFGGNPDHVEQKVFDAAGHGRRIEVTLLDDEVLVGTTLNYRSDSTGFFMIPADPQANNQRVFVVSSAVRQVRFP